MKDKKSKTRPRPKVFVFHSELSDEPDLNKEAARIRLQFNFHLEKFIQYNQGKK